MSVIAAAVKHMLAAGLPHDTIVAAVAEMEAQPRQRSAGAERTARWRAKKASQTVTSVTCDAQPASPTVTCDAQPSQTVTCDADDAADEPRAEPLTVEVLFVEPPKENPPKGGQKKGQTTEDWPSDAFERWYGEFPHKVGRAAAAKAFGRVERGGQVPFGDLMAALDRYIRTKPPDQPWCNPATWLNQERWADSPAYINGKQFNGLGNGSSSSDAARSLAERLRATEAGSDPPLLAIAGR